MNAIPDLDPSRPHRRLRRVIAALILLPVAALLIVVATEPWRIERMATEIETRRTMPDRNALPVWDPVTPRMMAQRMLATGPYQPDTIRRNLETSIARRPLYAPTWVDLAQLVARAGNENQAGSYLTIARKLWPTRTPLLWRTAMSQITTGHHNHALNTLGMYLSIHPGKAAQVLPVARKLQTDPMQLVQTLTAGQPSTRVNAPILASAVRLKDTTLAEAAWKLSPEQVQQDPKAALPYLQHLISGGHREAAQAAWRAFTGTPARDKVFDPSFERPMTGGGFGWRAGKTPGAVIDRDCKIYYHGSCSLRVQFQGTDNVNFHHVSQIVPVIPGKSYRISGHWRGDNITTRSGVFIEAFTLGPGKRRAGIPAKIKSWRWQPFTLDITIPPTTEFLQLRIRRQKTDALDRIIAGAVWFDAITLTPVTTTTSKHD